MAPITDYDRLLVKAARMYYEQELTQAEISQRLRLSRQKVQRVLSEARSQGIVQISIRPTMGVFDDLERGLEQRFGLREAVVVETTDCENQETVTREVGQGAAEYLRRIVQPGDSIVISWGTTLLAMVNALAASASRTEVEGVKVVQGLGGLGDPTHEVHAADLTRRLARVLGGTAVLLPAPGVAGTLPAAEALRADPHVRRALAEGAQANLALMSIGAPRPDSLLVRSGTIVSWPELAAVQQRGAVGDMNLRLFDASGRLVTSAIDRRIIGITLDQINRVDTVVGIAGGVVKREAIRAALAGKHVDVLITDDVTARHLFES
jgi:DNA-binding transcriptional regulator LsrR (DeoR family)